MFHAKWLADDNFAQGRADQQLLALPVHLVVVPNCLFRSSMLHAHSSDLLLLSDNPGRQRDARVPKVDTSCCGLLSSYGTRAGVRHHLPVQSDSRYVDLAACSRRTMHQ